MSPIKREFILYLEDMFLSMQRIEEYLGDLDFRKFKMTYMAVDAIIRNFEIIGEASKNIPTEIQEKYPEIPWRKMYGLRNLIAHEYFGIDYEMIWEIAKNDLPQNRNDLAIIIEKEKAQGGNDLQKL
ncbi:MAG: DUF86 domain-containing protein [Bacteroidales bacterium]|jgi:uncharacterized protein with HEPN domain|nr:DUF86 domain-containing protein [Bacteroidales bacterium]MDD4177026.1 DUF86 domain-containing protein [Bacteroidales bacterium]MDD4741846.1 DUF86 domain-containing protein [Bacteroidales bacterium]